jgi:hypothetical protein
MKVLHSQTRTAEVYPQDHPMGRFWEVVTYPKGTRKTQRHMKSQFHVFDDAETFVEFMTMHNYLNEK